MSDRMPTFRRNLQCPRLALSVFMLCKLLGLNQVQGVMFHAYRSVSFPNEKQEFIYSLFNYGVNSSKFIVSNLRMVSEQWMGNYKGSGRDLFEVLSCLFARGAKKDGVLGQYSNWELLKALLLKPLFVSAKLECYAMFCSILFLTDRPTPHDIIFAVRWPDKHGSWVGVQSLAIMSANCKHVCHTS
jgi:hypothetical protein